jgi:hypothetical protein
MRGRLDTRRSEGRSFSTRNIRTSSTSPASASTAVSASRSPRRWARSWAWPSSAGVSMSVGGAVRRVVGRGTQVAAASCVKACPTGALAFNANEGSCPFVPSVPHVYGR